MTFDLAALTEQIRLAALDVQERDLDPGLVASRLMDGLDDANLARPAAGEWNAAARELDEEGWRRLAVLVRLFRDTALGAPVRESLAGKSASAVLDAFPRFASGPSKLLRAELLEKSPFRVEELARKWVHALGGAITGESPGESRQRMERLDFGGVLKNLKAADADRAARMKKLQEIEAKRLREQQEAYERAGRE